MQGFPVGQLEHDPPTCGPRRDATRCPGCRLEDCPHVPGVAQVPDGARRVDGGAADSRQVHNTCILETSGEARDGVNADTAKENTWESQNKGSAK